MARITREMMFMEICHVLAKRSTCGRANVGALLTHENRIVGTGFNGPRSGEPHCRGQGCELTHSGGCLRSVHAEANLLEFMENRPYIGPLKLYVTLSPCISCAEKIFKWKHVIEEVYYGQEYRIRDGLNLLIESGMKVFRITPSGYIIDAATRDFVTGPSLPTVPSPQDC